MGVTCDLRSIDHKHVVEGGLTAINRALAANDAAVLRDFIASLPFQSNPSVLAMHEERLTRLRQLQAPPIILENEERMLSLARGDAYSPAALTKQSLDELRETLGHWNWVNSSYS